MNAAPAGGPGAGPRERTAANDAVATLNLTCLGWALGFRVWGLVIGLGLPDPFRSAAPSSPRPPTTPISSPTSIAPDASLTEVITFSV